MFNDLLSDSANVILVSRLNRTLPVITSSNYSTLEDYQTAIYSAVNRILSLQNSMQNLSTIKTQVPAEIGDLTSNFESLNDDANDTVSQLNSIENDAANLFNLGEASQTAIRQLIREQIYAKSLQLYVEDFINNVNIQNSTCTLDYIAGIAVLPLVNETQTSFSISLGTSSVGSTASNLTNLTDGAINTSYVWEGETLELILSFTAGQIVNRLSIDLDTYDGLEITSFTSSPDGLIYNDILASINTDSISLDVSSGKYSGSVIIDFPPQYVLNVKLIINNVIGLDNISLRNIFLSGRQYSSSGQITSTLINYPIGGITFQTDQLTTDLTNIIHQYSYDNVHFNIIIPGALTINQPFWYKALLSRSKSVTTNSGLIADPANNTYYTVVNSSTVSLGSSVTERMIVLSNITGPIVLSEIPLLTTLKVQINSAFVSASLYTFTNNTLTFNSNQSNATIIYQTSTLNSQTTANLENYTTPILREVKFKA
jgi:hypothetical protein